MLLGKLSAHTVMLARAVLHAISSLGMLLLVLAPQCFSSSPLLNGIGQVTVLLSQIVCTHWHGG